MTTEQKEGLQVHVLMSYGNYVCVCGRDCGWLSGRGIRREGRSLDKDSACETTRGGESEGNHGENV